jgi:branched-chain amino acid transport system substrate-binding protein
MKTARQRKVAISVAAITLAALALTACTARSTAEPSTSAEGGDQPIVIGASWPQSGPLGAVAPGLAGLEAYIQQVNDGGGVDGREIELVTADDAYDPARLVENEKKFVEQDGAIVVVNFGGISIAGRDYLKQAGVMGVSLAGNSPLSDIENYPLQRAFWPDVAWEGQLQGQWLNENQPDAVVGYIGFNNDLSESQLAGLAKEGVVPAKTALVAPGTSDLSAQVSEFQAAGVDTLIINIGAPTVGATLSYLEQIDWHPTTLVASTVSDFHTLINQAGPEAVTGVHAFQFAKDPSDPRFSDDAALDDYYAAMKASGHEADASNALALHGYGVGAALVSAITRAESVDSEGIAAAWDAVDAEEIALLRDGITLNGGPAGRIIFQYQPSTFDGTSWMDDGEIADVRELGIAE